MFYNKKNQDFTRRLKILEDRYGTTTETAQSLETDEQEDLIESLRELRLQFNNLQSYAEINRKGFVKITKKLDKKIEGTHAQQKYLHLKVEPCAFASSDGLQKSLQKINDWILVLTDALTTEISSTTVIPPKLHKSASREALRIPNEDWQHLEKSVRENDAQTAADILAKIRTERKEVSERQFQQFLKGLLQRAITSRSRSCVTYFLSQITFLDDAEDINKRNCLHRLVIVIGRAHSAADNIEGDNSTDAESQRHPYLTPATTIKTFTRLPGKDDQRAVQLTSVDEPIIFLKFLLENLAEEHRSALTARDSSGRTPLHFAAEYGIPVIVSTLIEHLRSWNMFNTSEGFDGTFWQDVDGWAPLHLAAIGGHPVTTRTLIRALEPSVDANDVTTGQLKSPKSSAALIIATKSNFVEVVRLLVQANVDLNFQDEQGDTALHVVARFGHVECARVLLAGSASQRCNLEIRETLYGWTPLLVASTVGQLAIVELLADAGAELEKPDWSGWTAREHAALRGHLELAKRLVDLANIPDVAREHPSPKLESSSPPKSSIMADRTSKKKTPETIKVLGHKYLTDKSMILVSLGTMDMHSMKPVVSLDNVPLKDASKTQLDTALSIVVSADAAEGESEIIDLPVRENIATEPIVFYAKDPSKVRLRFSLVPTYTGHAKPIGAGVAFLSSIKSNLGAKRMPLQGDITVPIIAGEYFEPIGSVTFNFLVVTPFRHPKMVVSQDQTYWKKVAQTMVIGHRGLGKNFGTGHRSLQLGENTVQSFITAANLGAEYVEFDVQLTKDHVPVIYHDFLVSETGIDAPVHTLTLDQFLHVKNTRTPKTSRPSSPSRYENPALQNLKNGDKARGRSMSVGAGQADNSEMEERMKHTRDFKKKGFKGNSYGHHVQAPFATLEQLFKEVPARVGFNIEMKYPMLSESQDEDMDWYAVELNSFVDTVLAKVYDLGEGRNIMFSSFNPDICLLLAYKQPNIPVLFLTDAGSSPVADIRASSLQEAIRFAARWNLLGIVSTCDPFVIAPRLIRVVKESGLVCISYGVQNNQNDKVRLQEQQGIDAVIVDSVHEIGRGLKFLNNLVSPSDEPIHDTNGLKPRPIPITAPQKENVVSKAESVASSVPTTGSFGSEDSEPSMTESPVASTADLKKLEEQMSRTDIRTA